MCSRDIRRMCVGALGLVSRNATTRSEAWTIAAGTSFVAILQKMQSLATPSVGVIALNLAESSVVGQYQGRSHHGCRLGSKDPGAERSEVRARSPRGLDLRVGEPALGTDYQTD